MALDKQVIPGFLDKGLNTKTDPKALPPFELTVLENAIRRQSPKWQKRPGGVKLGNQIIGSNSVVEDADAFVSLDDELLVCAKQSLYSYSEQANKLIDKGPAVSVTLETFPIAKNSYEQTLVDQAILNGVALVAWEDSRGGIRCTIYDVSTRAQLVSDVQVHASGTRPRCLAFGSSLYLFFYVSGEIQCVIVNPVSPLPLPAATTVTSNVNTTNPNYDVVAAAQNLILAFNYQGIAQITTLKLSSSLSAVTNVTTGEAATNCITIVRGAMQKLVTAWHNGTGVRAEIRDINLNSLVAALTLDNTAGTVVNITGYNLPDDSGIQLYYEYSAAQTYNQFIRANFLSIGGVAGSSSVFLRSVGIASKAFAHSPDTTNRGFVGISHSSTLQSTFFVARNDGFIVAKIQPTTAGGLLSRCFPATVSERQPGVFSFAILTKNPIVSADDSSFLSLRGVSIAELDFTNLRNFSSAQLGGNSHIIGGVLSTYDGQSVVEHGFHLFPENVSASQTTGGSLTLLGTYSYKVCYEWTDAKGQIHRSAPSPAVQIVLTGGNNRVTVTVPTLRITEKRGTRTPVNVVLYRTESLGTTYYRSSSSTVLTYNDTTTDTINFTDDTSDAVLIARDQLYTTAELENIGAPSASMIVDHKRRVILGGLEDDSIWYSKLVEQGRPVEFSDQLVINIPRSSGRNKAIMSMDDRIVVFKEREIFVVTGDGPDNSGDNGLFSEPERIYADVGSVDAIAIALTPLGIMFKSRKGYMLLGRDLSMVYIGAPVEAFNGLTATSIVVHSDVHELRITHLDGSALVYHWLEKQWSTFSNYAANDAILWKGNYLHIKRLTNEPAQVVKEVEGFFLDIDQKYSLKIQSGWISLAGILGFQRIWRLLFLGSYKSKHKIKVTVYYDTVDASFEEHVFDPKAVLSLSTYGESSPYGSEATYGGSLFPYLFRVHLAKQKSTSIKFCIEDVSQDESSYESYDLTGIAIEAGVKKGAWKTHSAATG